MVAMSKAASKSSITFVVRSLARASLRGSSGRKGGNGASGNGNNGNRYHSSSSSSGARVDTAALRSSEGVQEGSSSSPSTTRAASPSTTSTGLSPQPTLQHGQWPYAPSRSKGTRPRQQHHQHTSARAAHSSVEQPSSPTTASAAQFGHLPPFWLQPGASSVGPPLFFSNASASSSSSRSTPPSPPPAGLSKYASPEAGPSSYPLTPTASTSAASIQETSLHSAVFDDRAGTNNNVPHASHNSRLSGRDSSAHNLVLHYGAFGIPKRSKSVKGKEKEEVEMEADDDDTAHQVAKLQEQLMSVQVGEDAYFVRHNSLGVADGVGGWAGRKGADPGLFAARLMHHCATEIEEYERISDEPPSSLAFISTCSASSSTKHSSSTRSSPAPSAPNSRSPSPTFDTPPNSESSPSPPTSASSSNASAKKPDHGDPIEVLHRAWDNTLTEFFDLSLSGSSTALIALLKDDELRLANLGDCCCSIIRGSEYIFRSQEQQHSFNYPFQVGTNSQDTPRKDGQRFTIKVQKDDIVILSSDGLVDNLFDEDILEEVLLDQELSAGVNESGRVGDPQELSKALCSRAKAVSVDQRAVSSPFQQRANEEGIHFVGGKHDDISVLVAVIGDASMAP